MDSKKFKGDKGIKLKKLKEIQWEGWVYKRRNLIRKKRYLLLSTSYNHQIQIYYFASSFKKAKALGLITITQNSTIEKIPQKNKKMEIKIILSPNSKPIYLSFIPFTPLPTSNSSTSHSTNNESQFLQIITSHLKLNHIHSPEELPEPTPNNLILIPQEIPKIISHTNSEIPQRKLEENNHKIIIPSKNKPSLENLLEYLFDHKKNPHPNFPPQKYLNYFLPLTSLKALSCLNWRFYFYFYPNPETLWTKAMNCLMKNYYMEAIEYFKTAAERGHSGSLFQLGVTYDTGGRGIGKNKQLAQYYYHKAAALNHPLAQNNLGVCYHHGSGVKQDLERAYSYYTQAYKQGNRNAQLNLKRLLLRYPYLEEGKS